MKFYAKLLKKEEDEDHLGEYREEEDYKNADKSAYKDLDADFSYREVLCGIRRLENNKAHGEDGIATEFLKNLPGEMIEDIREVLNGIWNGGDIEEGWRKARIVLIHKGGDEDITENYRGISLLDVGYKLLMTLMAERLNNLADKENIMSESQAGFRKNRGTRDHIFVPNALINNRIKKGVNLYALLIDLKAAFDKVDRRIMMKKVWEKGIRGKMYKTIKKIYKKTNNEIIIGDKVTKGFESDQEVRQECALSAFLFDIMIDDMEEEMIEKKIGETVIGRTKIYCLKYADDAAVVAEDEASLKEMIRLTEKWAKKNKMEINAKKTKIMVFRKKGKLKKTIWKLGGKELEVVKSFRYLRFWFTTGNSMEKQTEELASKAVRAANSTWGLIKRTRRNRLKNRLCLMNSLVKSVMMYEVEVWEWFGAKKIESAYAKLA